MPEREIARYLVDSLRPVSVDLSALTGLYPRLHGTGERAPGIAGGPPPGHFSFKSTEGRRFLRTYPPDLESLPERLLEAGYSTKMVASNPLYFLSGLARDGFEIAVRARVSPGSSFPELARRLLLSSDPDIPLFLLVHYDADTLSGESLLQPPFATNRLQFAVYRLYGSELASLADWYGLRFFQLSHGRQFQVAGLLGVDDRDGGHVHDIFGFTAVLHQVNRQVHTGEDRADRLGPAESLDQLEGDIRRLNFREDEYVGPAL